MTAAIRLLHQRFPGEKIGVIGVSLGAASVVLSKPAGSVSAVVLESMYPTIREAVADRMEIRFGTAGRHIAPVLLWQLPIYTGTDADFLQPECAMVSLSAPVLIAAGDQDLHTPWPETERLFASAPYPKELWAVRGATHVDLYEFGPADHQRRILAFLGRHMRSEPGTPTPPDLLGSPDAGRGRGQPPAGGGAKCLAVSSIPGTVSIGPAHVRT